MYFINKIVSKTKKKLVRIMKISVILLSINLLTISATAYSQATRFSFEMENVTIEEVLKEVERTSNFTFLYRIGLIDVQKRVNLNVTNVTVENILNQIFEGAGISFLVLENNLVILTEANDNAISKVLQGFTVTGRVTDETGETLPGVTVMIRGTQQGTSTDVNGRYSLTVPDENATLVFSYIGFATQEIVVGSQRMIDVTLTEGASAIEELVVVGYGTMRRSDLTGSVVSVNMAGKEMNANVSLTQALQGYAAGVNVGSGERAGESGSISIRGQSSFSASQEPLIVLDGIIYNGDLNDIDVSDIEKVDILKDASAAAVFGSRSANGVIIITTKKGQHEKPMFNFNMYYGFQNMAPNPRTKVMNGDEFAIRLVDYNYYLRDLLPWYRTNPTSAADRPARPDITDRDLVSRSLRSLEEQENYLAGREINWIDKVYGTAPIQNYNLSVSGMTDRTNYYISGAYIKQNGIILGDNFNRFTLRANFENKITSWFTAGMNVQLSRLDYSGYYNNSETVSTDGFYNTAAMNSALRASPLANERDANGNYPIFLAGETMQRHPLINQYVDDVDLANRVFYVISAKIDVPFIQGLRYELNYSNSFYNRKLDNFFPTTTFEGSVFNNYATKNRYEGNEWLVNNIVSYSKILNDVHSINATLLYSAEKREGEGSPGEAANLTPGSRMISYGFQNPLLGVHAMQMGETQSIMSNAWEESSIAYMARLNYAYDSKYLLTATFRRDGYSGFGKNNKYADFPSVSAAWVLSREAFLGNVGWLDHLKIRLSYGINGNQGIGRYASLARISSDPSVFGGSTAVGVYPSSMGNSDLRWEKPASTNLGFDIMIFNNRISAEIDLYNSNTSDVLVRKNLPQISGYSSVWANLGGVNNKGIEIGLNTRNIVNQDFRWTTRFMFSLNRNKITDLYGDGTKEDIGNTWFVGEPLGVLYNYELDGVWQEEDLFNGTIYPNYFPGMYKIVSQDETTALNANKDRKIVGYSVPNYRFSISNDFSYKGFSLSIFINSIQGGNNYYMGNAYDIIAPASGGTDFAIRANRPAIYPYWRPDNPVNNVPAMYYSPPLTPAYYMSRSFIRLQDVSLSYNIDKSLLDRFNINNMQVYVSGKNLHTWTNWPGWSPEGNFTPLMRSFIGGIRMSF